MANTAPIYISEDVKTRFWAKVDVRGPDECWPWLRGKAKGYGRIGITSGYVEFAHRAVLMFFGIDLPADAVVDHECHNADPSCKGGPTCPHRACCNPKHLSVTDRGENVKRHFRKQTHCKRGHSLHDAYKHHGRRECAECARQRQRDRRRGHVPEVAHLG